MASSKPPMPKMTIAVLLLMLLAVPALAAQANGIVVWRLEEKSGVTAADIDSLSGIVAAAVESASGRPIVSEADIRTILKGEEMKQRCGADGAGKAACMAEIGNALGVPEAVSGDLGRLGNTWVLNLRRVDVQRAKVLRRVSRQVVGDIDALVAAVAPAARELFGDAAPVYPTPPAAVTAAEEPKTEEAPAQAEPLVIPAETVDEMPPGSETLLNTWQDTGLTPFKIGAIALWCAGGLALAVGAVGTWQVKDAKEAGDQGRHETWVAVSIANYAIGGAAVIGGILMWTLDPLADQPAPVVGFAPTPEGGAALTLSGRW